MLSSYYKYLAQYLRIALSRPVLDEQLEQQPKTNR